MTDWTAARDRLRLPLLDTTGLTDNQILVRVGNNPQSGEVLIDPVNGLLVAVVAGTVTKTPLGSLVDPNVSAGLAVPTGWKGATLPDRRMSGAGGALGGSGVMWLAACAIAKGATIAKLGCQFGSAANTPTHTWMAVYDNAGNLLGVTEDLVTTVPLASQLATLNMATPVVTTYAGLYRIGLVQVATTPATARGATASGIAGASPSLAATAANGSGLSDPASAPATLGTMSAQALVPYCCWG